MGKAGRIFYLISDFMFKDSYEKSKSMDYANSTKISGKRIFGIDFTKGFLVIIMVAYHTLNYFFNGDPLVYGYLYYVGPSFIFFSGFVCGTLYLDKFLLDRKYVHHRLLVRGLKLLSIFLITNLIINTFLQKNFNGSKFGISLIFQNLPSIFFVGNQSFIAFDILIPIAYMLFFAILLLHLVHFKYILYPLLILIFCIMSKNNIPVLYNTMVGIGGFFTGVIMKDIKIVLKKTTIKLAGLLALLIYLLILIPLDFNIRGNNILFYIYINLAVGNIYLFGTWLDSLRIPISFVNKFGEYSLYLYLAHIIYLQIFFRLIYFRTDSIELRLLMMFLLINSLLLISYLLLDYLKKHSLFVDKSYSLIFK